MILIYTIVNKVEPVFIYLFIHLLLFFAWVVNYSSSSMYKLHIYRLNTKCNVDQFEFFTLKFNMLYIIIEHSDKKWYYLLLKHSHFGCFQYKHCKVYSEHFCCVMLYILGVPFLFGSLKFKITICGCYQKSSV